VPGAYLPLSGLLCVGRPDDHVVCRDGERSVDWGDFASRVAGLARALSARHETRWLVHCAHPVEFAAALLALLHCDKRAVVPHSFLPGNLAALRAGYDGIIGDGPGATLPLDGIGASDPRFEPLVPKHARIELYTSGSSGMPKRVEKTLQQLDTELQVLESCWGPLLGEAAIVATVPHHHIYGLLFRLLWPLCAGRAFDAMACTESPALLQRLAGADPAALVSSPAHLARLPALIDIEALAPALRCIFSSGAALPKPVAQEFERRLGSAPIEVYGSTETGGIAWRRQESGADVAAWTPLPGVEVRVDERGALCLRSPFLATARWTTLDDGAAMATDGRFVLGERLDRVVKIEGKRISLPELEQRLREHPWVDDAGIVRLEGRKDALGAVVVLRAAAKMRLESAGRPVLADTLRRFLRNWFEPVLIPRRWRFLDRLPLNERGKIAAAELARMFQAAAE
jgi:acyl-coenzyme A synthetase/AMP-(fatty) acid ligase